jgi:imidazolonepropionase
LVHADLLLSGYHLLTMQPSGQPWGLIRDGALAVRDGTIQWVGTAEASQAAVQAARTIRWQGRFLSPGLIDCHTHLVWGGSRADEWERRLAGVSYEEIARRGGGILSTVQATRAATPESLYAAARSRVEFLMQQGVTTLEIKSGYGLDIETEQKILQVATDLRDSMPIDVQRTFLGAHAVPAEYADQPDRYVDLVCGDMLHAVRNHCEAVDVFCEGIGFNLQQTRRVLEAAAAEGLQFKVHAEQLSNLGGARLAASMGALSADHLEYLDESSVEVMAEHGTVAVLLPGAFYFIHETRQPPVELLRKHGVPMALATDANPGSSPVASLLLMMNMACTLFRLTPEEALAGVTCHAARALGMQRQIGSLEPGKQADLVVWDIQSPVELAWGIGHNPCEVVFKRGEMLEYRRSL